MPKQTKKTINIKQEEKKSAKQSSDLFHNIMKASVSGNPAPKPIKPPKKK